MPKNINYARIQNKHDIEANWELAVNFIPLAGELIIYDPDDTHDLPRIKIGDGKTLVNSLKFIDADLTDAIGDIEIPTKVSQLENDSKFITNTDLTGYATENYVVAEIAKAKLEGEEVDLSGYALKDEIPTKTSQLTNDSNFITSIPSEYVTETELSAKDYATKAEIPSVPVKSVNGKTGAVVLTASDVNALPNTTAIPDALADLSSDATHRTVTDTEKETWNAKSNFSGNYNDLDNKPTIPSIAGLATEDYADAAAAQVKNDLLNGAGAAYDTLKELGDLIDDNVDAIDALEQVAAGKADKVHTHPELISAGTADPTASTTSQFYFKYATN